METKLQLPLMTTTATAMSNNPVDMDATPVLQLWRIFTYYALHADPAKPQCLKVPHFIKLCKDAQIISKRVPATMIELEVAKLLTTDRALLTGTDAGNNPHGLVFADFLAIMDVLSVRVYPYDTPEVAMKRLLLENMFLLAGKRRSFITKEDVDLDCEAMTLLTVTYNKALMRIFNYYTHKADLRRTMAMASQLTRRGKKISSVNTTAVPERMTENQKKMMKSLTNLWGYEEFVVFCHDFNLKSTSLLTAIQAGEVYLSVVPVDIDVCTTRGMNFTQFCQGIICMAIAGYRDCAPEVTTLNKVKALLLFIWKGLNSSEKSQKAVNSRLATISSHAGSLNMYGSGLFIEQFLAMWTKDSFPDYTSPPKVLVEEEGVNILQRVVARTLANSNTGSYKQLYDDDENNENDESAAAGRRTSSDDGNNHNNYDLAWDRSESDEGDISGISPPPQQPQVITVTTRQLQRLFKLKPELTEFIHMEMVREGISY